LELWIKKFGIYSKLTYEMKNQQISLFQFYSYIDGSLHVSGPQAHPQENSGHVGSKHVEIRRYINKIEIVTSVGFSFHMLKGCTGQKA
jgi:hypothetical protein